jgi:hypothetical protein
MHEIPRWGEEQGAKKFLAPKGRGKVRGKSLHLYGLAVMANYV